MNTNSKLGKKKDLFRIERKPTMLIRQLELRGIKIVWATKTEEQAEELIQKATRTNIAKEFVAIRIELNAALDDGALKFVALDEPMSEWTVL